LTDIGIPCKIGVQTQASPRQKMGRKVAEMATATLEERWLTTHEASSYLGKSPKWLRENALYLEIPHMRVGRQYRFKKTDLDRVFKVSL
jgi:excisionase family DNA binding protein